MAKNALYVPLTGILVGNLLLMARTSSFFTPEKEINVTPLRRSWFLTDIIFSALLFQYEFFSLKFRKWYFEIYV